MSDRKVFAIVDDDEACLAAISSLVNALGYCTRCFANPADFLASDVLRNVQGLIADIRLPGISGVLLHDALVKSGITLPTMLMTAYPDDTTRAHVLRHGVSAYVSKPVSPDDLLAFLQAAFA
ncbi:response regulator transcription factor [Chelatococcus asaccharovorans]|uniref:Response regulator receiver domain-containing protein n=1 Tax=Chelatococcus asaccharovorans TaxID=28210 RepID=A0A2V3UGR5_9HYPH|nr:response regulator [Chelatococcus asaccharovorans]MBS7707223.1 response regulator [Chelatococcus asaccharovorans]PXW63405.1 response regulator receiver domain-containing protein [Chelatococcus asaccharovorans]CAH1651740.1 Response regulator receiver domain-containing protein [Chelatococcus asaccharovorans]CAH1693088.1 Response regulator receiver domain-containing protein [Chelatococcus asaccharovorans]